MASHHLHCHHPAAATQPSCYCHSCCATYTPCHCHHPLPPPDSHLHHPPHQPHLYSPLIHLPNSPHYPDQFQQHYLREERHPQPIVSSLLRRIAVLESALSRRSSHTRPSQQSLRDAAARTIQSHFRAFLVRRSITLRQLKDLASIKSALGVIKSSVSVKTRSDYDVLYHEATNLLLKLDAIQGGDPMIRNGKISLSRELNKILDFLEGICVERRVLSTGVKVRQSIDNVKSRVSERKAENVESGYLKRVNLEKLRGLVERIDRLAEELDEEEYELIKTPDNDMVRELDVSDNRIGGLLKRHGGVQPKVKKNVSFVENGKVYRVLRKRGDPCLEECSNDNVDRDDFVDDVEKEVEDVLCREIGEIGLSPKDDVEDEAEEGSLLSSDGENDSRHKSTSEGNFISTMHDSDYNNDFVFSAPLPVKMETRGNLIEKRRN